MKTRVFGRLLAIFEEIQGNTRIFGHHPEDLFENTILVVPLSDAICQFAALNFPLLVGTSHVNIVYQLFCLYASPQSYQHIVFYSDN